MLFVRQPTPLLHTFVNLHDRFIWLITMGAIHIFTNFRPPVPPCPQASKFVNPLPPYVRISSKIFSHLPLISLIYNLVNLYSMLYRFLSRHQVYHTCKKLICIGYWYYKNETLFWVHFCAIQLKSPLGADIFFECPLWEEFVVVEAVTLMQKLEQMCQVYAVNLPCSYFSNCINYQLYYIIV